MATGKPQLLFVHGIGRLRDSAADRRRWLQALAVGTRDAKMPDVISALTQGWLADVTFVNYSDLFNRQGAQGPAVVDLNNEHEVPFLAESALTRCWKSLLSSSRWRAALRARGSSVTRASNSMLRLKTDRPRA
ncbi:hypothetical protein SGRIM128S_07377 [Streptomyces griseomycini]